MLALQLSPAEEEYWNHTLPWQVTMAQSEDIAGLKASIDNLADSIKFNQNLILLALAGGTAGGAVAGKFLGKK